MIESLLEQAIMKTNTMKEGKIFTLKSLFKKEEWDSISKQDKLKLSSKFRLKVNSMSNFKAISNDTRGVRRFQKLN